MALDELIAEVLQLPREQRELVAEAAWSTIDHGLDEAPPSRHASESEAIKAVLEQLRTSKNESSGMIPEEELLAELRQLTA
ncbi:MAG: hypothetical protein KDK99_10925 [Verrucomicrobiales bacterium]|nr:hypothetical protein [Verrucomicrobiales bacterium]